MDPVSTTLTQRQAGWGERATALGLSAFLCIVGILVTPRAALPGPAIPGFMPAFAGAMVVIDLVLAVLLFSKGAIRRDAAPIRLGTAYLFAAMIIVPHIAAFPGAIVPDGLIGASATAVWLWACWHTGFAIAIARYVTGRQSQVQPREIRNSILGTLAIVVAMTLITTVGLPYLPDVVTGQSYRFGVFSLIMQIVVVPINIATLALVVYRGRLRSAQDLWLAIAMLAACLDVWLTFQAGARFSVGWYAGRAASLLTSAVLLVSLFSDITQLYSKVAHSNRILEDLAHVDGLTGIANRRHFDAGFETEWRRAQRDGRPLSLLMIDVDEFKKFNDRYGHQDGDTCLQQVAKCIAARARRPGDLAARYGGEEFALILPTTDKAGATFLAEALRLAIRGLSIAHETSTHGLVTVSVGVATAVPRLGGSPDALLRAADTALYQAKQAGRDQSFLADSLDVGTSAVPDASVENRTEAA